MHFPFYFSLSFGRLGLVMMRGPHAVAAGGLGRRAAAGRSPKTKTCRAFAQHAVKSLTQAQTPNDLLISGSVLASQILK